MNQWAFGWVVLNESGGNNSAHLPVAVKPTQNIPDINVTPTSLAATQAANTTTNQTLNIGNVGTGQLTWNIAEAPMPARLELTSARPEAPAAMADTNQPVSGSMGNDAMNLVSDAGHAAAIRLDTSAQWLAPWWTANAVARNHHPR